MLHEGDDLAAQSLWRTGHLAIEDRQFAFGIGIIDPVIQAAPLQCVMDFAGAVRRDDDDGRLLRLYRADLRDGALEIRQPLQQIGLEGRSEEHTSKLQSLMRSSSAAF